MKRRIGKSGRHQGRSKWKRFDYSRLESKQLLAGIAVVSMPGENTVALNEGEALFGSRPVNEVAGSTCAGRFNLVEINTAGCSISGSFGLANASQSQRLPRVGNRPGIQVRAYNENAGAGLVIPESTTSKPTAKPVIKSQVYSEPQLKRSNPVAVQHNEPSLHRPVASEDAGLREPSQGVYFSAVPDTSEQPAKANNAPNAAVGMLARSQTLSLISPTGDLRRPITAVDKPVADSTDVHAGALQIDSVFSAVSFDFFEDDKDTGRNINEDSLNRETRGMRTPRPRPLNTRADFDADAQAKPEPEPGLRVIEAVRDAGTIDAALHRDSGGEKSSIRQALPEDKEIFETRFTRNLQLVESAIVIIGLSTSKLSAEEASPRTVKACNMGSRTSTL